MTIDISKQIADKKKEAGNDLVFSYLTLRNLIGFGGMLLPIVLAIWPSRPSKYGGFEPSISDYFYTDRGDILVVFLCVIGTFLVTYKGYEWKEWALTTLAGITGMGVAFVPTKMDCLLPGAECTNCILSVHTNSGGVFKTLAGTGWHFGFAATFLLSLAIMSIFYFTKSDEDKEHKKEDGKSMTQKGKRNRVFRWCGVIIIASLVILGIYFISGVDVKPFPIVYFFETVAVEAFGFSWLVKGQTLWPDGEHYITKGIRMIKEEMSGKKEDSNESPIIEGHE